MHIIKILFVRHFDLITFCYLRVFFLGSFHSLDIVFYLRQFKCFSIFSMHVNYVLDNFHI